MKLDRFWIVQIMIALVLFALLIGSYLLSSGMLSASGDDPPPAPLETGAETKDSMLATAACVPVGTALSPSAIEASLGSDDPARREACLTFLQAESAAGDLGADLWLGRAYHNGWGVSKNVEEAAAHYRKAASAGDTATRESAGQWLSQLERGQ
ncbi:SEL1-like repeat protein [Thiothrix nivea]|uniref:Sel1 domain protein repeat-containing protein n=1 Tax=Thiothrix nivea (strain ATCC 35100 / DSM 5205 / JP2) TaxID=870187 RepID=A0A656HFV3_THINJ|nr:SEL1-like repeat protein [Thiothrix nivea]EIJ35263.1 Sel1 domain protein repeat-containing protein [Thiothrix nivea DSM 5205]